MAWYLADPLNPRVRVRNWLNKETAAEIAIAKRRTEALITGIRAQSREEAERAARVMQDIAAGQQRFDEALAAARDCATAEAMLAGQLRELLARKRQRTEVSCPSPEPRPDASAAPVRPERDPGSVDRSLPGEEG
ncbi:hypothetical protein [Stenotrophomonas sp. NRRL B-14846]|uniref:hypothetical protein n=1 Tax=Stenotrophomonas sp. NRRL B-14846 TaxID=3162882 RepID=UPI003D2A5BFA